MATTFQKILIGVASVAAVGSVVTPSKLSTALLWVSGSSAAVYLTITPKPWIEVERRRNKLRSIRSRTSSERKHYKLLLQQLSTSESLEILTHSVLEQERRLKQLTDEQEQSVNKKFEEVELLNKEVNQLKKLADEITADADKKARVEASKIKAEAEAIAAKIINSTRENLQVTVLEPERQAHAIILQQIELQKQDAIAQLERLSNLQSKTAAAIEKMKVAAQQEYSAIKQKLQKQAKEQFLKEMERMQQVLDQADNQVKMLATENQMLRSELEQLDEPLYPEGWKDHEIYARGIIDFYKQVGIKLDYKLSFKEGDRIAVRVLPREEKVGEQQLRRFHDRLTRKFELTEAPQIATVAGTIQFDLKLLELQAPVPEIYARVVQELPRQPMPQLPQYQHPEVSTAEVQAHLNRQQQREFQPPANRFSPFDPLTQTERDWVLWLYNFCGLKDQNTIIFTVWRNTRGRGVSQGAGQNYVVARDKLHQIFDDAGIPRRRANNANE